MFFTLPKANFSFLLTFMLLSANAFNLDKSKILLCGKELTILQQIEFLALSRWTGITGNKYWNVTNFLPDDKF